MASRTSPSPVGSASATTVCTGKPGASVYWASIVVGTLTISAYVITRTVGLLVGPAAHQTERIGFGDLTTTAFEAVLVVGSLLLLFRYGVGPRCERPHRRPRSGPRPSGSRRSRSSRCSPWWATAPEGTWPTTPEPGIKSGKTIEEVAAGRKGSKGTQGGRAVRRVASVPDQPGH